MKEKIKNILPWACTIAAAAMGIAAFFLIFAPSVNANVLGETYFKGLNTALGYTKSNIKVLSASAGMILAYLFPLLGAATAVIGKDSLIARIASTALFLVGGALSFAAAALVKANFTAEITIAFGSVLSGVFSILGGIAECATCLPCLKAK